MARTTTDVIVDSVDVVCYRNSRLIMQLCCLMQISMDMKSVYKPQLAKSFKSFAMPADRVVPYNSSL